MRGHAVLDTTGYGEGQRESEAVLGDTGVAEAIYQGGEGVCEVAPAG